MAILRGDEMAFKKITDADLKGKGNIGRPDTPGVTTAEMQRILDELSREVIIPAFNTLVDGLNGSGVAGDFGAQVPATLPHGTRGTVQDVLNALAKQTDDHKRDTANPHKVTAEQAGAYTKAAADEKIRAAVSAHANDKDNPHEVTAQQAGAYDKATTDNRISSAVNAHAGKTDNPHKVTAAQVGAYTKAETEKKITDAVSSVVAGEVPALTDAEVAEALGQI